MIVKQVNLVGLAKVLVVTNRIAFSLLGMVCVCFSYPIFYASPVAVTNMAEVILYVITS